MNLELTASIRSLNAATMAKSPKLLHRLAARRVLQISRACYMKFDAGASKEEVLQLQNAVCLKLKQEETSEETVQADTVIPDIMAVLREDALAEHQVVIFFEL